MKKIALLTASTLTFLSLNGFAKVHTTPLAIADAVTSIDSLNKKIVGLSSVSVQKFVVSKVDVTKAESLDQIGICKYEYTVYLSNVDSEVKAALNGEEFFSGKQNTTGKCRF